jgi:TonB-dependent SusC/RagA subfamily outer membrane receptor
MKQRRLIFSTQLIIGSLLVMSFLKEDTSLRNIQKIILALDTYTQTIASEKIYLHTDKSVYFAGERIWFKAYLIDGVTHRIGSLINPVYVELINPYQKKSQSLRLRISAGEGTGSFLLTDTIPEGIYQIRAYTNWMKNFGPEYFFNRNLEIRNPKNEYLINSKEARQNKKKVRKLKHETETYQIGFFPEGGSLLANVSSKIAFKATDGYGVGISVNGIIIDNKQHEILRFESEHDGMGDFMLHPLADKTYSALVKFPDGSKRKIPLPESEVNQVGLAIIESGDQISLKINSNKLPSNDRPANEFIIIGQVRGKVYIASSINLLDQDSIMLIDPQQFPSGVAQFTLFNNRLMPLSERLFFINHHDFINFEITGERYADSALLIVAPATNQLGGNYFTGSLAATIIESKNELIPQENILTDLLLTSDLPGNIQHPFYYLNEVESHAREYVDLLMLTHGWKRFIWEDVILNHYPHIYFEKEQGISIQGKITREIFEFPIRDANVKLFILNEYNDEYMTNTNKDGRFYFRGLDYSDTINVKIVARKPGGGKNVLIQLNEGPSNDLAEYSGDFFLTTTSKIDKKEYRIAQARKSRLQMHTREDELDSIFSRSIHGTPDYVIWGDEIPSGCLNALDAIRGRVPGVNVSGDKVIIRGINTIMGSTEPLLLIDDVPVMFDAIYNIPVEDIDRIEILKGPSLAMYGSRGANGVIAIYTKHGTFMKHGEISFSMLGYHSVEQFYSPTNKTLTNRISHQQLPITVSWSPVVRIHKNETVYITFPLSSIQGQGLQVIYEGITDEGRLGYGYALVNSP